MAVKAELAFDDFLGKRQSVDRLLEKGFVLGINGIGDLVERSRGGARFHAQHGESDGIQLEFAAFREIGPGSHFARFQGQVQTGFQKTAFGGEGVAGQNRPNAVLDERRR